MSSSLWHHWLLPARLLCPWRFFRQEYWSGLPCTPPGDLPNPGIEPRFPALQADSLPSEPPGKPKNTGVDSLSLLQENFPIQESNPGLLHCRWILYPLSHQGTPRLFKKYKGYIPALDWCVQISSLHPSCVIQDSTYTLCLSAFSCRSVAIIVPTLGSPWDLGEIMLAKPCA